MIKNDFFYTRKILETNFNNTVILPLCKDLSAKCYGKEAIQNEHTLSCPKSGQFRNERKKIRPKPGQPLL